MKTKFWREKKSFFIKVDTDLALDIGLPTVSDDCDELILELKTSW